MKLSCGISVVSWIVFSFVIYHFVLSAAMPSPGNIWASIGIGLVVQLCVGSCQNAAIALRNRRLVARSREMIPSREGIIAAAGNARALGGTYKAPFSGRPCVVCDYDVEEERRSESGNARHYSGYHMVPFVIDTMAGPIKLLGWCGLESVKKELIEVQDAEAVVAELETKSSELTATSKGPRSLLGEIKQLLLDDDGEISKDWKHSTPHNLERVRFYEKVVSAGEQVVAFGSYSVERQGMVFDSSRSDGFIKVMKGTSSEIERRLGWAAFWSAFGGAAVLSVVILGLLGAKFSSTGVPAWWP
jgi:hypothetical protein